MFNLTVIGLYFSLETVIFAFYGKFSIRMRMSPYSTNDVRMDFFLGFVSEMKSRNVNIYKKNKLHQRWTMSSLEKAFFDGYLIPIFFKCKLAVV